MPLVNAYYDHLTGVEEKHKEKFLSKSFVRWKAGDYTRSRYEKASMKQSRKAVNETIEGLAAGAKSLCLQSKFRRAAKVLSSDGVTANNIQTSREFKTLYPLEEEAGMHFQDSQAY